MYEIINHRGRATATFRLFLCAAALSALSACGDDQPEAAGAPDAGTTQSTPSGATASDGSASTPGVGAARFAVATQVAPGGAMPTSYVSVTEALAAGGAVSLDGALTVAGRALVAGQAGSGSVFVSGSGPELTKYTLDASDRLVAAGRLSFPGVASIGEYASQLQFVSGDKAYYFDTRTARVYVWSPTALTVFKTIELPGLLVPDATLTFSSVVPVRRAGKIVLGAGHRSSNNQRVIPQVALVVLDTTSDTATILRDDRCGYVRDAVEGPDGRVYLATEAWGSSVHRLNPDFAPKPCLLRTDRELTAIDESFYGDLNAIGGGVTGSLVASLDGKVYTRVLDEARAGITPTMAARALANAPAWRWAELTLSDAPRAQLVDGARPGSGSLVVLDTRELRLVADIQGMQTELVDLSRGVGNVVATTPGNTFSLAQVR